MKKIRKVYKFKTIAIAVSMVFLCNTSLYAYPAERDLLRVPVQRDCRDIKEVLQQISRPTSLHRAIKLFSDVPRIRKIILRQLNIKPADIIEYRNRPTIYIHPTLVCNLHCSFCIYQDEINEKKRHTLSNRLIGIFCKLTQKIKPRNIVIAGGGEPFMALERTLDIIQGSQTEDISLVTNASWGADYSRARKYLENIASAIQKNPSKPRVTIRISSDEFHQKQIPMAAYVHIIRAFFENADRYRNIGLSLALRTLRNDPVVTMIEAALKSEGFIIAQRSQFSEASSKIILENGMAIEVKRTPLLNPDLYMDLNNIDSDNVVRNLDSYERIITDISRMRPDGRYAMGTDYNLSGELALSYHVSADGNISVWNSQLSDNATNISEDSLDDIISRPFEDIITLSLLEKGISYIEDILNEVNPKAPIRAKVIHMSDFYGRSLFVEPKDRLYLSIRLLQKCLDDKNDKRVTPKIVQSWPEEIRYLLSLNRESLIEAYKTSEYSVMDEYLDRENISVYDIARICWFALLGHYADPAGQIVNAVVRTNRLSEEQKIKVFEAVKILSANNSRIERVNNMLKLARISRNYL